MLSLSSGFLVQDKFLVIFLLGASRHEKYRDIKKEKGQEQAWSVMQF